MRAVFRIEGKYLRYGERVTHTGVHQNVEWVGDIHCATVFYIRPHLQSGQLQDTEEPEATEMRIVTLMPDTAQPSPVPVGNSDACTVGGDNLFGEFTRVADCACRKCKEREVRYRIRESWYGGHEDCNYKCFSCGHTWWVDGIDE